MGSFIFNENTSGCSRMRSGRNSLGTFSLLTSWLAGVDCRLHCSAYGSCLVDDAQLQKEHFFLLPTKFHFLRAAIVRLHYCYIFTLFSRSSHSWFSFQIKNCRLEMVSMFSRECSGAIFEFRIRFRLADEKSGFLQGWSRISSEGCICEVCARAPLAQKEQSSSPYQHHFLKSLSKPNSKQI